MLSEKLAKVTNHLKSEAAKLQVGTANAGLVDSIVVDSYGSEMPLKAVANISCPDTKTIKVEPWDKSLLGAIEQAIQQANIGINPQNMGDHLYLPIPPMTEDRRRDLVKRLHELVEQSRISVRNARHDELKSLKQQKDDKVISEDQYKDSETKVQETIDQANQEIEAFGKTREADIMKV